MNLTIDFALYPLETVVFLVYLYQRYLYPVDKKRPNEFGMVYEDVDGNIEGGAEEGSCKSKEKED